MYKIILILICLFTTSSYAQELRDPTQPLAIDPKQLSNEQGIVVKGVIISPTQKLVYIGNRTLTIGDEIMETKIVAIEQDAVKLKNQDGEIITISIFKDILKIANSDDGEKP